MSFAVSVTGPMASARIGRESCLARQSRLCSSHFGEGCFRRAEGVPGLSMALSRPGPFLLVAGDAVFTRKSLRLLTAGPSALLVSPAKPSSSLGAFVEGGFVTQLRFRATPRWGGLAWLAGPEADAFRGLAAQRMRANHLAWELLHSLASSGGRLLAVHGDSVLLDSPRALARACLLVS